MGKYCAKSVTDKFHFESSFTDQLESTSNVEWVIKTQNAVDTPTTVITEKREKLVHILKQVCIVIKTYIALCMYQISYSCCTLKIQSSL